MIEVAIIQCRSNAFLENYYTVITLHYNPLTNEYSCIAINQTKNAYQRKIHISMLQGFAKGKAYHNFEFEVMEVINQELFDQFILANKI